MKRTNYILFSIISVFVFAGCSLQQKQAKQVKTRLSNIQKDCYLVENEYKELYRELNIGDKKYRMLIFDEISDHIQHCDSVIFIEERRSDRIGYQTCYVYLSDIHQVKTYKADWSAKKISIKEGKNIYPGRTKPIKEYRYSKKRELSKAFF